MTTKEQYEFGARNLAQKIRNHPCMTGKMMGMIYLGNLRMLQYRTTGEQRAKRLAENCYDASSRFFYRAVCNL